MNKDEADTLGRLLQTALNQDERKGEKMKFSEWLAKLQGEAAKLNDLPVPEVRENLFTDGRVFEIVAKPGELKAFVDGEGIDTRYLRPEYTNNKAEFDGLLESLTDKIARQVSFADQLMLAVTEQAVPDLVIRRLKGENVSSKPQDVLREATKMKLDELVVLLQEPNPFRGYTMNFEAAGKIFSVNASGNVNNIIWDGLRSVAERSDYNLEKCMYFLTNFEIIKKRVEGFIETLKVVDAFRGHDPGTEEA